MTEDHRPDPDALLAQVQREQNQEKKGRLFILLGMCPGVGKTSAMLLLARQRQSDGLNVLAGIVETHGRAETTALLEDLTILPRKKIDHGGHLLEEFDLDTAIQRRPDLLLVDELAHTNAPGSRHLKRYQDVLELLDAGIDVVTTLNVPHIESQVEQPVENQRTADGRRRSLAVFREPDSLDAPRIRPPWVPVAGGVGGRHPAADRAGAGFVSPRPRPGETPRRGSGPRHGR